MSQSVSVDELKIGMFVHLDLGWMSHPFPRSSFRLESAEQIGVIRSLGLSQLRWDPSRSLLAPAGSGLGHGPGPRVDRSSEVPGDTAAPAVTAEADDQRSRRRALLRQREVQLGCEAQYQEAGRVLDDAFGRVVAQPHDARAQVEALSGAMRDKMLGDGETCIRVLNVAAGDRATAHAMNVAVVSMLLAHRLGLGRDAVAAVGVGALLHDVGKLQLPAALRHDDPQLGTTERQAYCSHVEKGLQQARRMGMDGPALGIVECHHEMADGSGFPRRLGGEGVPLPARIVSLVNRFDNLCNPPVLARAMTPHEAVATLFAHQRSRHDATVMHAFIRMMGVYPAGSLVQLTDDRYALVISVNADRPLKPRVLVHDPASPRDEALLLDLQQAPELGIRRSFRAAQLPAEVLDYLSPRPRVAYYFEPLAAAHAQAETEAA
jgi:putative nucleotidyltransferase with HDIG domain